MKILASHTIPCSRRLVYQILVDFTDLHSKILPRPPFDKVEIISGGQGDGTILRFKLRFGFISFWSEVQIAETRPGFLIHERDRNNKFLTSFELQELGHETRVSIQTEFFEMNALSKLIFQRFLAPKLEHAYQAELINLEALAKKMSTAGASDFS